jgi:hypothetical protein
MEYEKGYYERSETLFHTTRARLRRETALSCFDFQKTFPFTPIRNSLPPGRLFATETIRVSICDRMERLLKIRTASSSSSSSVLRKTIGAVMGTGASPNTASPKSKNAKASEGTSAEASAVEEGDEFAELMKWLFMCYFDVYMVIGPLSF